MNSIFLRDLSDDFYSFDEDTMTVTGSTTGNEYGLGDYTVSAFVIVQLKWPITTARTA